MESTTEIVSLFEKRPWLVVAAFAIGLVVRLLKDDIKGTPNVPSNRRVFCALGLGVLSGLLEKKLGPSVGSAAVTWIGGLLGGLGSAVAAITGHNVLIDALRGGREIPVPFLTKPGISPSPGKPPSIPPPAADGEKKSDSNEKVKEEQS